MLLGQGGNCKTSGKEAAGTQGTKEFLDSADTRGCSQALSRWQRGRIYLELHRAG